MKTVYILRKDGYVQRRRVKARTLRGLTKVKGSTNLYQSSKRAEPVTVHFNVPEKQQDERKSAYFIRGFVGFSYEENRHPFYAEIRFKVLTNKDINETAMFDFAAGELQNALLEFGISVPAVRDREGIESTELVETEQRSYFNGDAYYASWSPPSKLIKNINVDDYDDLV